MPDVEKRKYVAKLLAMLLGMAAKAASSFSPSRYGITNSSSNRGNSMWSSILSEISVADADL